MEMAPFRILTTREYVCVCVYVILANYFTFLIHQTGVAMPTSRACAQDACLQKGKLELLTGEMPVCPQVRKT